MKFESKKVNSYFRFGITVLMHGGQIDACCYEKQLPYFYRYYFRCLPRRNKCFFVWTRRDRGRCDSVSSYSRGAQIMIELRSWCNCVALAIVRLICLLSRKYSHENAKVYTRRERLGDYYRT